jgi:hypothetical protein
MLVIEGDRPMYDDEMVAFFSAPNMPKRTLD